MRGARVGAADGSPWLDDRVCGLEACANLLQRVGVGIPPPCTVLLALGGAQSRSWGLISALAGGTGGMPSDRGQAKKGAGLQYGTLCVARHRGAWQR